MIFIEEYIIDCFMTNKKKNYFFIIYMSMKFYFNRNIKLSHNHYFCREYSKLVKVSQNNINEDDIKKTTTSRKSTNNNKKIYRILLVKIWL